MRNIASRNPTSPTRLVTNAFLPATAAALRSNQNDTRRYEQSPTPSQPRNVTRKLDPSTRIEHRGREQVEVGEEPRVARVAVHVADRVEVDQRADAGDEQDPRDRQAGRRRSPCRPRAVPAGNHVNRSRMFTRASAGRSSIAKNITDDQTNASAMSPVAIQPATGSPMRFPKKQQHDRAEQRERGHDPDEIEEIARHARRGAVPQEVEVVGGGAAPATEDRDDDREADRDLGRGHHEREEHERPGRRCRSARRRTTTNVRFTAFSMSSTHMNITITLRRTRPDRADREEHRRQHQVVGGRDRHCSSSCRRRPNRSSGSVRRDWKPAGRCAWRARRSRPPRARAAPAVISNGQRKSVNSERAPPARRCRRDRVAPPLMASVASAGLPVAHSWPARKMISASTIAPSAERRDALVRQRVARATPAVDAEQHDHEEEQHDDRARVHDDLHGGEQVGVLHDEEHRHAHERDDEQQRGVHRVAREHHTERAAERERRRTRRRSPPSSNGRPPTRSSRHRPAPRAQA